MGVVIVHCTCEGSYQNNYSVTLQRNLGIFVTVELLFFGLGPLDTLVTRGSLFVDL